jgi:acyl-CoA synthetase (AMP-forming)/AMP-acid ligase II
MPQLAALISRSAAWYGSRIAVEDGWRAVTFTEVERRSNRLANALMALAPQPRSRVALLLTNRIETVEIDLAIIKSGLVKVPINTRLKHEERAYVINDSGATILVFDESEEESVSAMLAEVDHQVALIRVGSGRLGRDYEMVINEGSAKPPNAAIGPDDPSLILYTSGTTGRPKGATTTFAARLAGTMNMLANEIDPQPGDAMAHVASMAHGSGSKILAHFVRGSRNVPIAKWDPAGFLRTAEDLGVTHSFMVPTMIDAMVEVATGKDMSSSPLTTISYGGAPIAPVRLQAALEVFGQRFVQVYGSCEAPHPVLVMSRVEHVNIGDRFASAGRETVATETRIVDGQGDDVADGEHGELLVRAASIMRGYWNDPVATAEVLHDGWYHTGDVVRRGDGGFVYIVDRARDMIISGGYNIYPAELEAVLARHPDVAEVAVVGVPDQRWGEAVKAIIVARRDVAEAEILEHCNGLLAGYKRPKSVDFVDALPKGSTGKILRRELRDPYWEGMPRRV